MFGIRNRAARYLFLISIISLLSWPLAAVTAAVEQRK